MRETGLLVVMAVIVGFVFNAFSPGGLSVIRLTPEKIAVPDSEIFGSQTVPGTDPALRGGAPDGSIAPGSDDKTAPAALRIISLDQLRRIMDGKKGMLIDARTPEEYADGHIGGAVNMYGMDPGNYFDQIVGIERDSMIVVYCSNPHCPSARSLAGFLLDFGFTNVLLYDDGWDGWTDAGMPAAANGGSAR